MSAHTRIPAPLETLARQILAGTARIIGECALYCEDEWKLAADEALAGDDRDLAHMLKRQAAYDAFLEWRGSARSEREAERREWVPFEDWMERIAA